MFESTEAEKKFFAKRDKETEGLHRCESYYIPNQLIQKGCTLVRSEYLTEGKYSYEYHVFEKNGRKIVYNEVYIDREGGMYHQNLYTEDGQMP